MSLDFYGNGNVFLVIIQKPSYALEQHVLFPNDFSHISSKIV